ncbi:glycoside hydrolase family 113 [Membranihabitans marinus]|uniref:glycoside hydrolase family 113 n=1 Tax=Membranihabitans marinus TaxID=1227546 RepID=UPI001F425683|nr:hypothetical protein [Membranihabitans marinus]
MKGYYLLFILFCSSLSCCILSTDRGDLSVDRHHEIANGVTLVAPPKEFDNNPMLEISKINANWVALNPFGFTATDEPAVHFNNDRQWWGEKINGIIRCVEMAHNSQLKVLLKPHIWARGIWCGDIKYESEEEWRSWEEDYLEYITTYARVADSTSVDMFCIGTELKQFVIYRPQFWQEVIDSVKSIYSGPLTYASNWDEYEMVDFWDRLDYIGVNAYFPLHDDKVASMSDLTEAWKPIRKKLETFHKKWNKDILFTEYGYLSTEYNAHNTWEKEKMIKELEVSQEAQQIAIDALYQSFHSASWWYGGFLWKWYPDNYRIRNKEKDYTPQGKLAEQVLIKWFNK